MYSSDLSRAADTTKFILQLQEATPMAAESVHLTPLLRELRFGVREALPRGTSVREARDIVAKAKNISKDEVVDDTETLHEVRIRQQELLERIYKDLFEHDPAVAKVAPGGLAGPGEEEAASPTIVDSNNTLAGATSDTSQLPLKVLAVSHGGFIKSFLRHFCADLEVPEKISNCAVSTVLVEWLPAEDGGCGGGYECRCSSTSHLINQT